MSFWPQFTLRETFSPVLVGPPNCQCRQGPAWGDPRIPSARGQGPQELWLGDVQCSSEKAAPHTSLASLLCSYAQRSIQQGCLVTGCCPLPAPIHTSQTGRAGCRAPLSSWVGGGVFHLIIAKFPATAWKCVVGRPLEAAWHWRLFPACSRNLCLIFSRATASATRQPGGGGGGHGQSCYQTATRQVSLGFHSRKEEEG